MCERVKWQTEETYVSDDPKKWFYFLQRLTARKSNEKRRYYLAEDRRPTFVHS